MVFVLTDFFMKEFAQYFYRSKKWKSCRKAYIAERMLIDGGLCEACHERAGYIVHHKINLDSSSIHKPEIALNSNNLMYVCKKCHDQFDGHFEKSKRRTARAHKLLLQFDESGDPSPNDR
jgi:5-methylcytosine-specific restriction endonuclease McrA